MSATGRPQHVYDEQGNTVEIPPGREEHDNYPTPAYCTDKLLPYLDLGPHDDDRACKVFEPCVGEGGILDRIPSMADKDGVDIRKGTDYLTALVSPQDIIITNPPYSLAQEFITKSLREAPTVIYLLRLNFLGSTKRRAFWQENIPTHCFVITPRPRFVNKGSDSCEYGWIVWDRGHRVLTDKPFVVL